jgi:hypothetical protein
MAEFSSNLTDKTMVVAGPFGLLVQNITMHLTSLGADVVVITDEIKGATRLCQNIMDQREVSEKFGRAFAVEGVLKSEKDVQNNFSRAAEVYGSIDGYVDCYMWGMNHTATQNKMVTKEQIWNDAFQKTKAMCDSALQFVKARNKGRILILFHEMDLVSSENNAQLTEFQSVISKHSQENLGKSSTINAVGVGVNEEYLLTHFTKGQSIQKSLLEIKKTDPNVKLVDYSEIANWVGFMVSPNSQGLSGQIIRLNHGCSQKP